MTALTTHASAYPVSFTVDYPDRPLNRLTTALGIIVAIPHFVILLVTDEYPPFSLVA